MTVRILLLIVLLGSCKRREPAPVQYGSDACAFCKMTIMDKRFAASLLTSKGRTSQFDAVECLVDHLETGTVPMNGSVLQVADFSAPGTMTDAGTACYLVSENIASPMGRNISAYASMDSCRQMHQRMGGAMYSWNEIKKLSNKQ